MVTEIRSTLMNESRMHTFVCIDRLSSRPRIVERRQNRAAVEAQEDPVADRDQHARR